MSSPAITVATSVYNGERFLADAIESVLAQTFTDFEFLLLDDGSSDTTRDILHDYAARDSRIRLIIRENRGLIASLNQLLGEARAPIIARMDADDICRSDRFEKQHAFLMANPDHGVVGSWSEDIDENGTAYFIDAPVHPVTHEEILAGIDACGPVLCHPAVAYRRDLVRGVGGYHTAFRHCEDHDLWLRLASITRMANIPARLLRYRHYTGQVSSRHVTEQQIGAAIANIAYQERKAGRPDPTAGLERLPPVGELDALFGRPGIDREVRAHIAARLLYSPIGLRDQGFELICDHIRDGGKRNGMWRTVLRLMRFGNPVHAARLATILTLTTLRAA